MNREERERGVDRLLDDALAARSVEPRPGLEERILANLRSQPLRRPWWHWAWVPAAAVVLIVIGVYVARRPPVPAPARNLARQGTGITAPPARHEMAPRPSATWLGSGTRARGSKTRATRAMPAPQPLPRQAVFPTPVPLTEQEKLLTAFVQGHRAEAVLVAQEQASERERIQKYIETGNIPEPQPGAAPDMR